MRGARGPLGRGRRGSAQAAHLLADGGDVLLQLRLLGSGLRDLALQRLEQQRQLVELLGDDVAHGASSLAPGSAARRSASARQRARMPRAPAWRSAPSLPRRRRWLIRVSSSSSPRASAASRSPSIAFSTRMVWRSRSACRSARASASSASTALTSARVSAARAAARAWSSAAAPSVAPAAASTAARPSAAERSAAARRRRSSARGSGGSPAAPARAHASQAALSAASSALASSTRRSSSARASSRRRWASRQRPSRSSAAAIRVRCRASAARGRPNWSGGGAGSDGAISLSMAVLQGWERRPPPSDDNEKETTLARAFAVVGSRHSRLVASGALRLKDAGTRGAAPTETNAARRSLRELLAPGVDQAGRVGGVDAADQPLAVAGEAPAGAEAEALPRQRRAERDRRPGRGGARPAELVGRDRRVRPRRV